MPDAEVVDEEADGSTPYVPDMSALASAKGSPHVWAHALHEMVGHLTGTWIDEESFENLLFMYAEQVARGTYRDAGIQAANEPIPVNTEDDPSVAVLMFRSRLSNTLLTLGGI